MQAVLCSRAPHRRRGEWPAVLRAAALLLCCAALLCGSVRAQPARSSSSASLSFTSALTSSSSAATTGGPPCVSSCVPPVLLLTAHLQSPIGVAVGPDGSIYVSDTGNSPYRVVKLSPSGALLQNFTTIGPGLYQPAGVVVDGAGFVYCADDVNNRVVKWAPSGVLVAIFNTSSPAMFAVISVTLDTAGNVWAVDGGNKRVVTFSANGTVLRVYGNATIPHDGQPQFVVVDASGAWYYSDTNYNRVVKVSATGAVLANFTHPLLRYPLGLAFDTYGFLYVSSNPSLSSSVLKFSSQGVFVGSFVPPAPVHLQGAYGLAFDCRGNLYVADALSNNVVAIPASNLSSTPPGVCSSTSSTGPAGPPSSASAAVTQPPSSTSTALARTSTPAVTSSTRTPTSSSSFLTSSSSQPLPTNCSASLAYGQSSGLLVNGGFECGQLSYWDVSGAGSAVGVTTSVGGLLPHSGSYMLALAARGADGVIVQSLMVYSGGRYNVSFWLADLGGSPADFRATVNLTGQTNGTVVVAVVSANSSTAFGWAQYWTVVQAPIASAPINLTLTFAARNDPSWWAVDDVQVLAVAGGVCQSSCTPPLLLLTAQLVGPSGIAVGPDGSIYVAETYRSPSRVVKLSPSGVVLQNFTTTSPPLNGPWGVVVDAAGFVYCADSSNSRVVKWAPSGDVVAIFTTSSPALYIVFGLALDAAGNVWVVDYGNRRVVTFSPNGAVLRVYGNATIPSNVDLEYIVVDVSGAWYYSAGGRVVKVSAAGAVLAYFSHPLLQYPNGLALDSYGSLYVASNTPYLTNGSVLKFTSQGTFVGIFLSPAAVQFEELQGLAFDCLGHLYVANNAVNSSVVVIPASTLGSAPFNLCPASTSSLSSSSSGAARAQSAITSTPISAFSSSAASGANPCPSSCTPPLLSLTTSVFDPAGVAVGPDGNIYASDYYHPPGQVVKFSPSGVVLQNFTTQNPALWYPYGVAVDAAGFVYCADNGNARVVKWAPSGVVVAIFDTSSPLLYAAGVAFDAAGNVWAVDISNRRVVTFSPSGAVLRVYGNATIPNDAQPDFIVVDPSGAWYYSDAQYSRVVKVSAAGVVLVNITYSLIAVPTGLALDSYGFLYVAMISLNGFVMKFTSLGVYVDTFVQASPARLDSPAGLAFDCRGNLYAADLLGGAVVVFPASTLGSAPPGVCSVSTSSSSSSTGAASGGSRCSSSCSAPLSSFTVSLVKIAGVAVGSEGSVYFADRAALHVAKLSSAGLLLQTFTTSNPSLAYPWGVAVDGSGYVYCADSDDDDNSRVVKWAPSGTVVGIFTTSSPALKDVAGVTIDGAGNVWVADGGNGRIVRFSSSGSVQAVYGTGIVSSGGFPYVIAADASGVWYYTDLNMGWVVKVSASGHVLWSISLPGAQLPAGLKLDYYGAVYVVSPFNASVLKFTSDGAYVGEFVPPLPTRLLGPLDLAIDRCGNLYLGDTEAASVVTIPASVLGSAPPCSAVSIGSTVALTGISATSLVRGRNASLQVFGSDVEQVLYLLVANHNLSQEAVNDSSPAMDALSTVNASNPSAVLQWAGLYSYQLGFDASHNAAPSTSGAPDGSSTLPLNVSTLYETGYHRLVVLSSTTPPFSLVDWLYSVDTTCTTLLTEDGVCYDKCPNGCFCTGDGRCWPEPGWWSVNEHSPPVACVLPSSCPGSLEQATSDDSPDPIRLLDGSRVTSRCSAHYVGEVCGQCGPDYFHIGSACRYCGATTGDQVASFLGLLIGAAVIIAIIAGAVCITSAFLMNSRVGTILTVQQLIVIGITGTQLLPSPKYDWLVQVFADISITNLDVNMFHPGCAIAALSYVGVFWATILLTLGACGIFVLAALVRAQLVWVHITRGPFRGYFSWWRREEGQQQVRMPAPDVDAARDAGKSADQLREDKLSRRMDVMRYIDSWPVHIRPDLTVGFHMSQSSQLHRSTIFVARLKQALLACGALVYLRVTTVILQVINCGRVDVGGDGGSQLKLLVDKRTLCYQGSHTGTAAIAWMLLFGFSLGFPLLLLYLLRRAHSDEYLTQKMDELQVPLAMKREDDSSIGMLPTPSVGRRSLMGDEDVSRATSPSAAHKDESALNFTSEDDSAAEPSTASSAPRGLQVDTAGANRSSRRSHKRDESAELVQERVEALSPRYLDKCKRRMTLTPAELLLLDEAYLAGSAEMVFLARFATYGFLLSSLNDRRHMFALSDFVVNFALACLVVLPKTVSVQVFVSAWAFVIQCLLVALIWPFSGIKSNLTAMASNCGLVLQCLVALALIQDLAIPSGTVTPHAVASVVLQDQLKGVVVNFLSGNGVYLGLLAGVFVALVITSSISCFVCGPIAEKKRKGRMQKEGQPKVFTSPTSPSQMSEDTSEPGSAIYHSRALDSDTVPMTPSWVGGPADVEMTSVRPRKPGGQVEVKEPPAWELRRGDSTGVISANPPPPLPARRVSSSASTPHNTPPPLPDRRAPLPVWEEDRKEGQPQGPPPTLPTRRRPAPPLPVAAAVDGAATGEEQAELQRAEAELTRRRLREAVERRQATPVEGVAVPATNIPPPLPPKRRSGGQQAAASSSLGGAAVRRAEDPYAED